MFKHFRRDLTHHFSDDIRREIGRYFEVYLFDDSRVTHCCELTPSYECWPVSFYAEKEVSDETEEVLHRAFGVEPVYVHCSIVDGAATALPYPFDQEEDEEYDEYLERVLEYYRCNSYLVEALI